MHIEPFAQIVPRNLCVLRVNHSKDLKSAEGVHTNHIEGMLLFFMSAYRAITCVVVVVNGIFCGDYSDSVVALGN